MPWAALAIGGSIVSSLWGGYSAKKSAEAGGEAAYEAAQSNAADLRGFGEFNAESLLQVGAINANAIIDVGEINAQYIERATDRNLSLYGLQADEDVRRHVIAERQVAGEIRARASGSGVQVNTGSPLQYMNSQVDEGIRQRRYMVVKHFETMKSMDEEGADRAYVTRYTADKNAEVTMANAEANAAMALANAELAASQQETAGELALEQGHIAGQSAMIQGITGAVGAGISGYSMFNNSPANLFQSAIGSQGYSMQGWSGGGNWGYTSAPIGSNYAPGPR